MKSLKQYNLVGYSVGTTNEMDLLSTPLRLSQIAHYTYRVPWRSGLSFPIILRALPQQIWSLYRWEVFMMYAIDMVSDGMI
jgi:hypothetical protein